MQTFTTGCGTTVLPAGGYYIDFMVDNSSFQVTVVANGFAGISRYLTIGQTYGTWNSTFVVSLTESAFGTYAQWVDGVPQSISSPRNCGLRTWLGRNPPPTTELRREAIQRGLWDGRRRSHPALESLRRSALTSGSYSGTSGQYNMGLWDSLGTPTGDGDNGPLHILGQGTPFTFTASATSAWHPRLP